MRGCRMDSTDLEHSSVACLVKNIMIIRSIEGGEFIGGLSDY